MAVNRQGNFLGQQRVDIPHLRSMESGVCYDFDAVGLLMTGGVACVINGFEVVNYATIIGANASSIVIKTADSRIVHPLASDSGSFFQVPSDRANETLDTNNARVLGSWTPSAVNYVGADLLRSADDTTSDTVRFLDASSDSESDELVPLARTMDYVITISTSPFSASPTICPLLKVTLNANSAITAIQDARNLMFRLGSGGDAPKTNNPFGWPGGRNEGSLATAYVAGDRSIKSFKQWCDAVMTRLQEVGGGEYWYSLTSDRNVRLAQGSNPFESTGEAFEWVTNNLHWKGLKVIFDNSTGYINEIQDEPSDSPGLTNLADGECIYVDLDRTANKTGASALVAQKAALSTLGGSTVPGQRWVIAYRVGSYIYIKDQSFPVGSAWKLATTAAAGLIKTTINANGIDSGNAVAIGLAYSSGAYYTATCGGLSHNIDIGPSHLVTANDLVIGRGTSAGDDSIFIQTNATGEQTVIYGKNNLPTDNKAAVKITQGKAGTTSRIVDFAYTPTGATEGLPSTGTDNSLNAVSINSDGSIAIINADTCPSTPVTASKDKAQVKTFCRADKVLLPHVDALFGLQVANANSIFTDWSITAPGVWTKNDTTALGTTWTGGVTITVGSRVLVCWPLNTGLTEPNYATDEVFAPYYRIYEITSMGGSGNSAIISATDDDLFEGVVVKNEADTGAFDNTYFKLYTPNPITVGTTNLIWAPCNEDFVDMVCLMDGTGAITPVYNSIPHLEAY